MKRFVLAMVAASGLAAIGGSAVALPPLPKYVQEHYSSEPRVREVRRNLFRAEVEVRHLPQAGSGQERPRVTD